MNPVEIVLPRGQSVVPPTRRPPNPSPTPGGPARTSPDPGRDAKPQANEPVEGWTPASVHLKPKATDVYWLPWSEWWTTSAGFRIVNAMSSAFSTKRVRRSVAIAQSTIRRDHTSSTAAGNRMPAAVGTYVMSATQSRFGSTARKSRLTRPLAGLRLGTGTATVGMHGRGHPGSTVNRRLSRRLSPLATSYALYSGSFRLPFDTTSI